MHLPWPSARRTHLHRLLRTDRAQTQTHQHPPNPRHDFFAFHSLCFFLCHVRVIRCILPPCTAQNKGVDIIHRRSANTETRHSMTARADKDETEMRELGRPFTSIIYCQYFSKLKMQFNQGTLRFFMQSDEGKLSFMSRKTELLPANHLAQFRKFPRASGHASASRSPHDGTRIFTS